MPFDSWGSMLEGQVMDIEDYIQWVGNVLNNQREPTTEWEIKANEIGQKLLRSLIREKELRQMNLDAHRQHDRERDIKY